MALIQTVHLSMANFKSAPVVPAVQNDTDRQVKMIIDDFELTAGLTGKIAFQRSDGTHYETSATLNTSDNSFTADIDQALTQPGRTMVQLKVTDTLTVSTFSFVIFVEQDNSGTVTPQEGIDLVSAVQAAEDAADRAEAAAELVDAPEIWERITESENVISHFADNFPEINTTYSSGNITSTGAINTNTSYLHSAEIGTVYAGDTIISDGEYYFKVAVYSSATASSQTFIGWVTPDGYTTITNLGKLYSSCTIPETYQGRYIVVCAFKSDGSNISSEASGLLNHIKILRIGEAYRKIGYEATLTNSDDLNDVKEPGIYRFLASSIPLNVPYGVDTGWVIVESAPNRATTMQLIVSMYGIMSRTCTSGVWTDYYNSANAEGSRLTASGNLSVLNRKLFPAELFREITLTQGAINRRTGANLNTSNNACRTGYIKVPSEDIIIDFNNLDYTWVCWSYSSQSVSSATHANSVGNYPVCDTPIAVKYVSGDKYIRLAFMRVDGAVLTTDLADPTSDYSIILNGLHIYQGSDSSSSLNKVNMSSIRGNADVTVVQNEDGTVTASTVSAGTYRYVRVLSGLQDIIKPNTVYALRAKIISTDSTVCYFRFRGTSLGINRMGGGITGMTEPGEYACFYRATGYETVLDFFITGTQSASAEVTFADLMIAETDISMPYIPYGISQDSLLPSVGVASDSKIWGVENTLASGNQYAHVRWTPVSDLPSQFSSIDNKFSAGVEYMGVPYSSARGIDKLIGPQVSLYTFLTAVRNPRSVLFTRKLTYNNARTYYGTVCSAFIGHCYHTLVNYATADMREWNQLERIEYPDLRPGDLVICSWHVQLITSVYRDQYGRIMSVGWSEAGDSTVKDTMPEMWSKFSETHINNPNPADVFYPYRYKKINGVEYAKEKGAIGYPDETIENIVIPDIMPEYGDKAVLREGESTIINVLDGTGYSSIKVYINETLSQTISTIADFTLSNLTPGHYEIEMTGANDKESSCEFFVCETECSFDNATKILTFDSSNAVPVAVYVYTDNSSVPLNKVVNFTEEDITNGYINLSDYLVGDFVHAKMAFAPVGHLDWGVATWYTKTPEEMELWTIA